jgi:hypothetical protein
MVRKIRAWRVALNQIRGLESNISRARGNVKKLRGDVRRNLQKAMNDTRILEDHVSTMEKELARARSRLKWNLENSRKSEIERRKRPKGVPTIGKDGVMDLKQAMMFFASLVEIFSPEEAVIKEVERTALVRFPLRMEKRDVKSVSTWFYANLARDCAEECKKAIKFRELGITLDKKWVMRKASGKDVPEGQKLPGTSPDHPLIWTGTLVESIEGWSEFAERAAFYGIRGKKDHPISDATVTQIAKFMVNRFNFLARPAVKRRVRAAAIENVKKLINLLVA